MDGFRNAITAWLLLLQTDPACCWSPCGVQHPLWGQKSGMESGSRSRSLNDEVEDLTRLMVT